LSNLNPDERWRQIEEDMMKLKQLQRDEDEDAKDEEFKKEDLHL
jgi:hypothetical protein